MTIQTYFPGSKPKLLLDFSNTKYLDTRVSFSRSTTGPTVVGTATYYDSSTVTKSDENLLIYSQQFNDTSWISTNITVLPDVVDVAPDDTQTAETLTATAGNSTLTQSVIISESTDYTFSIYIKRRTGTGNIDITCNSTGSWVTQSITSSWARYTVTQNLSSGTITPGIRIATNGDEIDVWGAQLEQRNFSTYYTQTVLVPRISFVSTLLTVPENTPRFAHIPVSRIRIGLLIESTSTNLITYSEDFSNGIYTYTNCSAIVNQAISPSGTLSADKLVIGSGTGIDCFNFVSLSILTTNTYTISCYAKRVEHIYLFLGFNTSASEYAVAQFNLDLGTVQFSNATGTGYSIVNSSITNVTNGWFRCQVTVTSNNTTENIMISPSSTVWTGASRPGTGQNGNNFKGILVWGAQVENKTRASSYISTNGTAITRNSDSATITGSNLQSFFSGISGTFVSVYVPFATTYSPIISLDDNTSANKIVMYIENSQSKFTVVNNSTVQCLLIAGNISASNLNKSSIHYARNSFLTAVNFNTAVSDFIGLPSENITTMRLGGDVAGENLDGAILKIAYYPLIYNAFQMKNLTV